LSLNEEKRGVEALYKKKHIERKGKGFAAGEAPGDGADVKRKGIQGKKTRAQRRKGESAVSGEFDPNKAPVAQAREHDRA